MVSVDHGAEQRNLMASSLCLDSSVITFPHMWVIALASSIASWSPQSQTMPSVHACRFASPTHVCVHVHLQENQMRKVCRHFVHSSMTVTETVHFVANNQHLHIANEAWFHTVSHFLFISTDSFDGI